MNSERATPVSDLLPRCHCGKAIIAKGLCSFHYRKARYDADPEAFKAKSRAQWRRRPKQSRSEHQAVPLNVVLETFLEAFNLERNELAQYIMALQYANPRKIEPVEYRGGNPVYAIEDAGDVLPKGI